MDPTPLVFAETAIKPLHLSARLAHQSPRIRNGIAFTATARVLSAVIVILTASRATVAFSDIGLGLTLLMSMTVHVTRRKAMMGVAAALMLLSSYPLAKATLDRRFKAQRTEFFTEDKEREPFIGVACGIIAMTLHGFFEWMLSSTQPNISLPCCLG
jgi:hypothetical protein